MNCNPVAAGCPPGPIQLGGRMWCLGDSIGKGSYGKVYKGQAEDDPTVQVAVKVFTGGQASAKYYYEEELAAAEALAAGGCVPEFACLLAHGSVDCGSATYYCMVFPLALGDLSYWMKLVNGGPIKMSRIIPNDAVRVYEPYHQNLESLPNAAEIKCRLVECLVDALFFMKDEEICHRDIKPPNVLVYGTLEDPKFVIGDLGSICARPPAPDGMSVCEKGSDLRGTVDYLPWGRMRTEGIKFMSGKRSDMTYHSVGEMQWADVFAVGCTIYEFFTGLMAASIYMSAEDNPRTTGKKYYPLRLTDDIEYTADDGTVYGMRADALESMVNTMIFSETPRQASKWLKYAEDVFYSR